MLTRLRLRLPSRIPVNYHHTQTTNFRTKQDVVPRGTTPRPMTRKHQRPIASLFDWFSHSQSRRPYITQLCLTPLIFCLGDFSAQMIGDDDFDYHRSLRSVIIGLVIAIPSHEWFLFLGRRFNYSSSSLSLGAKVAANQTFYTPMFNVYFFAFHGLLAGEGLWGAIERVKNTASISIPRSFLYWPLVTAFNFSYIKPQSRSIVTSIFSVFWQSYLSWLNSSAGEGKEKPICNSGSPEERKG
jgi:protein Mpv17